MCGVLFPLWVAWVLLGHAQLRPILPISAMIQIANVAIHIALPLWLFSTGRKDMEEMKLPSLFLYGLQSVVVAAHILFRGKGWKYALGYMLMVGVSAAVRTLHYSYIFNDYVRSDSDKIVVVLVYQPLTAATVLSIARLSIMALIDLTPEEAPDASKWFTVYAALSLVMQVTGRYVYLLGSGKCFT